MAERKYSIVGAMKQIKRELLHNVPFAYALPAFMWQLIFLCVPLVVIFYASITDNGLWTLNNYRALCDNAHVRIIVRSLVLACANVFLCLVCAYPVAYYLAIRARRFKQFLVFLLILPFWSNFLVQVYAWFFLLGNNGLIESLLRVVGVSLHLANSLIAVFLVMVYCYIPFMILPIYSIIEKISYPLLEASADLGATPWQTFRRITLPLSMPGIRTGILLVLVPSFGEFIIPELMGGSKYMMVGSLISYYFLVARDNAVGSAFTMICGCILLIVTYIFHRCIKLPEYGNYGGH